MRGLFPFIVQRLFRALIALWLVSTVVFVVMRLSGDPVPLLLPPDAPISEMNRVRRELGLDRSIPYSTQSSSAIPSDSTSAGRSTSDSRLHGGERLPRGYPRARD
jgi:peptide/nickel transport system permease protein